MTVKTKDRMKRSVHGVGYLGIGEYVSCINYKKVPAYACWKAMLGRCYSVKDKAYPFYGAKGVTVCDEWHNYQNYAEWFYSNYKQGFDLDKDNGTVSEYSPSTCAFIPHNLNQLMTFRSNKTGLKVGVNHNGKHGFCARINRNGIKDYLGTYGTEDEAYAVYVAARIELTEQSVKEAVDAGDITAEIGINIINRVKGYLA